ncbi:MAG: hypothetical protein JNM62_00355 [Flavobacteriales bacterium]|nr:hypothetical protein [Flavobacteriales bacterium]
MTLISTLKVSCRKATELMERKEFRALGVGESVGLWFHMHICGACRTYERQREQLDRLLHERAAKAEDTSALEARILREFQR